MGVFQNGPSKNCNTLFDTLRQDQSATVPNNWRSFMLIDTKAIFK